MKILFISSGNTKQGISSSIRSQAESLIKGGCEVSFYKINNKGFLGYIKHIFLLKRYLKTNKFNIYHAHYSFSAIVATLAWSKPLIVSLMGSDVKEAKIFLYVIKFLSKMCWDATIVKSEDMKKTLGLKNVFVIPNGVDFNKFQPIARQSALDILKWDKNRKHILFAASKLRPEKNYALFKKATKEIISHNVDIHTLEEVDHNLMPYYYNAADVVVLTSKYEGSPNVIKEAMACNRPIVATDVGDIKESINGTTGCYIVDFNVENIAKKINLALALNKDTEGRDNIKYLRSEIVAQELIYLYNRYYSE